MIKNHIGCDIVKINRVEKMLSDKNLLAKLFHPSELTGTNAEHLSGIFAVKEASIKALGLRNDQWLDIEVRHEDSGKPVLIIKDEKSEGLALECSISHDGEYAFAVVLASKL